MLSPRSSTFSQWYTNFKLKTSVIFANDKKRCQKQMNNFLKILLNGAWKWMPQNLAIQSSQMIHEKM